MSDTRLHRSYYGPTSGAIAASTFILIGQALSSVGATVKSYPLFVSHRSLLSRFSFPADLNTFLRLLVGQIILGFGSTAVESESPNARESLLDAFTFRRVTRSSSFVQPRNPSCTLTGSRETLKEVSESSVLFTEWVFSLLFGIVESS